MVSSRELARRLPDIPRWVEVRDYLLSGDGEVSGLAESPDLAFVVRDPLTGFLVVVGKPSPDAIVAAAAKRLRGSNLVAAPEHAGWVARALPEWTASGVMLHLLRHPERLPPLGAHRAGFVERETLERELSDQPDLLHEIELGADGAHVAASFAEGRPVAFCYAGSVTETLWDVSIDTLKGYRRKGHAASAAAFLIRHMKEQGREPVWAAIDENPASWRLARKIGFEQVDELVLFEPPD